MSDTCPTCGAPVETKPMGTPNWTATTYAVPAPLPECDCEACHARRKAEDRERIRASLDHKPGP